MISRSEQICSNPILANKVINAENGLEWLCSTQTTPCMSELQRTVFQLEASHLVTKVFSEDKLQ